MPETADSSVSTMPDQLAGHVKDCHLPRTRDGKVKRRFTFEDKLRILDPTSEPEVTQERLMAFMNLFAFRTTGGIITRAGCGPRAWAALRSPISPEQVARHLLADSLLPVFGPQWVGSRSPSTSCYLTLDVDADRQPSPLLWLDRPKEIYAFGYTDLEAFTKDREAARKRAEKKRPFADRCLLVEDAVRLLGPDPDDPRHVTKQPTPSGGLHYILLLDGPYFLSQIYDLLRAAGLRQSPGQIEFFPSNARALRLPFGHLPGRDHDPQAWIKFTDAFLNRRIRRHSLEDMYGRMSLGTSRSFSGPPTSDSATPSSSCLIWNRETRPAHLGLPKAKGVNQPPPPPSSHPRTSDIDRYSELIESGCGSIGEAKELFDLGILVPGTRTAALKQLAAHFIWFRHRSAEEAEETLTRWAMDVRHQSKDIRADLADGTEKVAKQIATMCRWYEQTKRSAPPADRPQLDPRASFAPAELDALIPAIQSVPMSERTDQVHFFLNLLAFAKKHGRAQVHGSGWEVAVAINAVVRKWPGCRGKDKYKARMDRAKDSGLLVMTKDKWQRPGGNGRARTYLLSVPCVDRPGWTISYPDALARLTDPTAHPEALVHPTSIDNAVPRSSDDEQPHEPAGLSCPHPLEDRDPRPLHPRSAGGSVGSRPPQCPFQPAPIEALPHRVDEAVPAISPADDPGTGHAVAGGAGQPKAASMTGNPGQTIAEAIPFDGLTSTSSELSPRLGVILAKPINQLSFKESRLALDFLSRQQQRGAVIPGGVLIRLQQKTEAHERARSARGDEFGFR